MLMHNNMQHVHAHAHAHTRHYMHGSCALGCACHVLACARVCRRCACAVQAAMRSRPLAALVEALRERKAFAEMGGEEEV